MNLHSRAFGKFVEYVSIVPIVEYFNHECTVYIVFTLINIFRVFIIHWIISKMRFQIHFNLGEIM